MAAVEVSVLSVFARWESRAQGKQEENARP